MQDKDIQKLEEEGYEVISRHPLVIKRASEPMTRNPDRIPIILNKLESVWSHAPCLRLGQLLYILNQNIELNSDLFYLEDDKLEYELDRMYQDDNSM